MPVVWCDGGSQGNPGPAAIGFVLEADGETLAQGAGRIGTATAAMAEYRAVFAGLSCALSLRITSIEVRSDSRLLVAQMQGDAPVRSARIVPLADETRALTARFGRLRYRWIPEAENGRAHGLVEEALQRS
ncbi:MAG: ribonuclease / adenosylcobalamin/alpha-ribazole phosphatase [Gaiellales bacterium]|nr:ribonuclease / adenosylcobalamin/alpha-ribazole phosphatase [Gaiellales bacterium]